MNEILEFLLVVAWIAGLVIVKGFWLTLAAVLCPPYSWYVLAEWLMGRWM